MNVWVAVREDDDVAGVERNRPAVALDMRIARGLQSAGER